MEVEVVERMEWFCCARRYPDTLSLRFNIYVSIEVKLFKPLLYPSVFS
jgi:hypothetical protein